MLSQKQTLESNLIENSNCWYVCVYVSLKILNDVFSVNAYGLDSEFILKVSNYVCNN